MATAGNTHRPLSAFRALYKSKLNERRDVRVRYRAPFHLLWDELFCQPKYARAVSNEVSEHGLSLETAVFIPVGTYLSMRSENRALFGGALVKHASKRGFKYVLGVEFSYSLLDEAQALVREVYSMPRTQ